ncbi:MAG: AraC-like DNA-binding protein [Cocleimonas sp.]|jgi:AraC-like DNA-binding protein
MNELIQLAKRALNEKEHLPFSVYSSVKVQNILNVPIIKPLLIYVLDGEKKLGDQSEIVCPTGSFVFLSNSPMINMRNIPQGHEYFAVLLEFDFEDFEEYKNTQPNNQQYCLGKIDSVLEKSLEQFIEWSLLAPEGVWPMRKREILQTFYHLGYDVYSLAKTSTVTHRLHEMISLKMTEDVTVDIFCSEFAMSESTLRRKLIAEGTSLQEIKDQTKLGHGLHLIQTTADSIGLIADQCGYQSQSRFTDRFKQRFGITPTALRKTKVHD